MEVLEVEVLAVQYLDLGKSPLHDAHEAGSGEEEVVVRRGPCPARLDTVSSAALVVGSVRVEEVE